MLHVWLLFYRILISVFMLSHGWPKLLKFFASGDISFPDPLGIGTIPSLALTVLAEVGCSILIILGLGTRFASFALAFTMSVAAFIVHSGDPFKKMELSLLFLVSYIFLLVTGPGKYSVDRFLKS
ncbi:MAG: DoxX family protein [Bacteroidales bacterium]|nr:DoxX family protein [Bacteroidales bacterium]